MVNEYICIRCDKPFQSDTGKGMCSKCSGQRYKYVQIEQPVMWLDMPFNAISLTLVPVSDPRPEYIIPNP